MFFLNLPVNKKEQAAIERRRYEESKRLDRIFNVKYRTIGIDKSSLDEQVQQRQYMNELEKQRSDAFHREMIKNDLEQIQLEQEELSNRRQFAKEINDYRQQYQRPEQAREWDLNDPDQLKKSVPMRIHDDDSRLGISSAQIFAGEDLQVQQRKKVQQKQLKRYFDTQIMVKTQNKKQEHLADLLYDYKQLDLSERSNALEHVEKDCRRAIDMATRNYNEILAHETKTKAQEQRMRQTEEQLAEIVNSAFSDFLTENTKHVDDSGCHILVDRWKGMSQEQLDDIRQHQLIQIIERQTMKEQQKCFDETWQTYANAAAKQGFIIEQQIEDERRSYNHSVANENQNLAKLQRERQDYFNKTLYRSIPTAAFYQQFNTSSR